MQGCNVWNIDTGAAFTGKPTVMDVETKQFWQSDRIKSLYPGEMGISEQLLKGIPGENGSACTS